MICLAALSAANGHDTLALIGRNCGWVDGELARAAAKAAALPKKERPAALAAGQHDCEISDAWARAETIAAACPPRREDPQGTILKSLDAGTYVFIRALNARLGGAHPRVLDLALQAAATE